MRRHLYVRTLIGCDQRIGRFANRPVGNVFGLVRQGLRTGCEHHEFQGIFQIFGALGNDIIIHIVDLMIPDHDKRLVFFHDGIEDAAAPAHYHHSFTVGEHLGRLRSCFPKKQ